jgi:hypothetical protein
MKSQVTQPDWFGVFTFSFNTCSRKRNLLRATTNTSTARANNCYTWTVFAMWGVGCGPTINQVTATTTAITYTNSIINYYVTLLMAKRGLMV